MLWLLAGIVVVWFAVASAGFRRLLVILVGVAIVGGVLLFTWFEIEAKARTREEEAAKLRIPHSNVEFVDLRMGTDSSFVKLTGRVRNMDSRYTLTRVELRLRVQECPPFPDAGSSDVTALMNTKPKAGDQEPIVVKIDGIGELEFPAGTDPAVIHAKVTELVAKRCDTVGDTTESLFLNVPPQQTREVDEYVSFSGIGSPRMKRTWSYTVVSISSRNGETQ